MKIIHSTFMFIFFVLHLSYSDINSQIINSGYNNIKVSEIDLPDTNSVESPANNIPWSNSLFISVGYSSSQGTICELGYNIFSYVSLAANLGMHNKWTGRKKVTLGIIGKVYFLQIKSISNYILIGYGGTFEFLTGSDTYYIIHFGSKINLTDGLYICPEFGPFFASERISGGLTIGGLSPVIKKEKILFGVRISLEINF